MERSVTKYSQEDENKLRLRDLSAEDRPRERLQHIGARGLSTTELLAIVIGTGHGNDNVLHLAQTLLSIVNGLPGLVRASRTEMEAVKGIGEVKAIRIKAALELGRRAQTIPVEQRPQITSPADAANLLMSEMMYLEQEHLRLITLDTRNRVLDMPTIYKGSLNSAIVRIGELFRSAIRTNAAALIVAHNHPSGDPSPSPEDVHVTRQLVRAGKLLDIEVIDHIVIGRQSYVSLKERGEGFD